LNVAPFRTGAITNKKDAMNAHILRKWSPIKIFMYLLLVFCSLLIFWCRGASAMHLTPLDFKSSLSPPYSSGYSDGALSLPSAAGHESDNLKLQKLWQMRMREKRMRIQAHRKEKLLLQRILDQRPSSTSSSSTLENLKHQIIDHNILLHHNNNHHHNINDNNKNNDNSNIDNADEHRRESLIEVLNEIRTNISLASSRNRRESRFHNYNNQHHSTQQQQQQQQHRLPSSSSSPHSYSNNNNNNNINVNNHHHHRNKQAGRGKRRERKGRYCPAKDPQTLAFEAPTVFEGKIKSMTSDRATNFSATVEIVKTHKHHSGLKLPKQVRLQFAYRNASVCDIYREEFRYRGFVRDELEQGKIYFFFVKQVGLSNFTILGQPIRKISRTANDVELGVKENYGEWKYFINFLLKSN
jgi:hypothetical protein